MKRQRLITILSIAGSDSCAGAGIQADIKAAAYSGIYASTVVTAVTAQSTSSVSAIHAISPEMIRRQLETVFHDQVPDAIKIGMIGSVESGNVIIEFIRDNAPYVPVVVDTVMSATSGAVLSSGTSDIVEFYRDTLLPIATVATPNLMETARLLSMPQDCLINLSPEEMDGIAAKLLDATSSKSILLKGGHLSSSEIRDVLAVRVNDDKIDMESVTVSKIDSPNLHGTGCTLSSLIACSLAKGKDIKSAFLEAESSMNMIIGRSCHYQYGLAKNGPLNVSSFLTKDF